MTPDDDITPEEMERLLTSIDVGALPCEACDNEVDGVPCTCFDGASAEETRQIARRALAALRRRDEEIERQKRVVESLSTHSAEVEDERDAAKALLARAVTLLREWEKADNVPADFLTFTATRALLAEIEAEHGK